MAWRPHGHARISARNPRSTAICDGCGFIYNLDNLSWQFQWAGTKLQNLRFLNCPRCLDVPQAQLKTRIIPADPTPVMNARPENFLIDDSNFIVADDSDIITADDGEPLVTQNVANNREDAP